MRYAHYLFYHNLRLALLIDATIIAKSSSASLFNSWASVLFLSNNQGPRGKPTSYELENTFQKLRGKPREIKPSGEIKIKISRK
jgi:hypothetical protein